MPRDNYARQIVYQRTIDGDTFAGTMDLLPAFVSPNVKLDTHVRVHNWSAAELREAEGPAMRDAFEKLLKNAKRIDLELRAMSFRRIVASVWLDDVLFAGLLHQRLQQLRRGTTNAADS
jgi:hypothetical protein